MSYNFLKSYNPSSDATVIFICLILFIVLKSSFIKNDKKFKLFNFSLLTLVITCFSDIFIFVSLVEKLNPILPILFSCIFVSGCIVIFETFIYYLYNFFGIKNLLFLHFAFIINTIGIILTFIIPFYNKEFYYVNDSLIISIKQMPFTYVYLFDVVIVLYEILKYKKQALKQIRKSIFISACFSEVLIAMCNIFNINSLVTTTFLLPIIVILLCNHSNSFDNLTGALNKESFEYFVKQKQKENYLCLKLELAEDKEIPYDLGIILRTFWEDTIKNARLFNPRKGIYILSFKPYKQFDDELDYLINKLFKKYYQEFKIDYKIAYMPDIDFVNNYEEFMNLLTHSFYETEMNSFKECSNIFYSEYLKNKY